MFIMRRITVFVLLITIAAVFMFVLIFPVHKMEASAGERKAASDYISYVVKSGDTLWDIADANLNDRYPTHADYIRELMRVNGMKSDRIFEGELIVIPVR